jgi:hypothetical protein
MCQIDVRAVALELRRKPRLFGKFFTAADSGGVICRLFIKLQFILCQQAARMVNHCFRRRGFTPP